jgi:hypothetical protein
MNASRGGVWRPGRVPVRFAVDGRARLRWPSPNVAPNSSAPKSGDRSAASNGCNKPQGRGPSRTIATCWRNQGRLGLRPLRQAPFSNERAKAASCRLYRFIPEGQVRTGTRCWRERDSNPRSPGRDSIFETAPFELSGPAFLRARRVPSNRKSKGSNPAAIPKKPRGKETGAARIGFLRSMWCLALTSHTGACARPTRTRNKP